MLYGLSLEQTHKNDNSWTIDYHIYPKYLDRQHIANMADPYQTAPKCQVLHYLQFRHNILNKSPSRQMYLSKFYCKYGRKLYLPNTVNPL